MEFDMGSDITSSPVLVPCGHYLALCAQYRFSSLGGKVQFIVMFLFLNTCGLLVPRLPPGTWGSCPGTPLSSCGTLTLGFPVSLRHTDPWSLRVVRRSHRRHNGVKQYKVYCESQLDSTVTEWITTINVSNRSYRL